MHLHFQGHNEAKRPAKPIREYMRQKFMLSEEYLGELRCFEYEGNIDEGQVLRLLIFNPHLARRQHTPLQTHADLEQHPEVLLYEGYVDAQGRIYIEDLRTMSYPERISGQWL